jgi:CheY-like chemotaxis protein
MRVMVVDDEPAIRTLLVRSLGKLDADVVAVCDGAEALAAALVDMPDVIVTDLDMPVMDGVELCRRIRANAAGDRVGIVVLTGGLDEDAAMDAGCDIVLRKPWMQQDLLDAIRRLAT